MRSSSACAFRSASAKSMGAAAFFAPSLAGRADGVVVVLDPRRAAPSLGRLAAEEVVRGVGGAEEVVRDD
jgi:hypothetical protein